MRIPRLALSLSRAAGVAILAGVAVGGCQTAVARKQWVVTISTNARVPQFGDRLLVEVVDDAGEACSACRRLLDASDPSEWPLSFGVVPTGKPLRVRVRLLRAASFGPDGSPPPGSTIDLILPLPDDVSTVSARLDMDCFGIDADLDAGIACDPDTAMPAPISSLDIAGDPLALATWDFALPHPCAADGPAGTRCVEGGAFLMGDVAAVPFGPQDNQPAPERLVRVSAFHLDEREMTVGDYLELKKTHALPEPAMKDASGVDQSAYCSYHGTIDTSTAAYPLNCLRRDEAEAICEARDMRLPTEAEWEFAAGNGPLETRFPWGDDEDICKFAIVARADVYPAACRDTGTSTLPAGPEPHSADSPGADVTTTGLVDMGGNVAEWTADDFAPYGQQCWSEPKLENPLCDTSTAVASTRGGCWKDIPLEVGVVRRHAAMPSMRSACIGLRCASSD